MHSVRCDVSKGSYNEIGNYHFVLIKEIQKDNLTNGISALYSVTLTAMGGAFD
jgi:hypothetical protein